uniref:Uncharacterized protein n=1 Tax=viral metagenome TaxID=1070528 RepID=A0A6M3IUW5_9ZZZZ
MDQRDPQATGQAAWFDKANLLSRDWAKGIEGMTIGDTISLPEVMQYAIVQVINKYYVRAAEESGERA